MLPLPFPTSAPLDGLRVLVLDQDADGRELLRTVLQQRGALVRTAASVADALESLEAWRPDVLVSDSVAPEHDSYALVGKVLTLEADRGGRIPAAALTAWSRINQRVRRMLEPVLTRPAETRRACRSHSGDREAGRARTAPHRAIELTAVMAASRQRRLSAGVETQVHGGAHARVWAPDRSSVDVVFDARPEPALAAGQGVPRLLRRRAAGSQSWRPLLAAARSGSLLRPDPVSRYQPDGPHGPSQVVDPSAFRVDRRTLARPSGGWAGALRNARRHVHPRRDLARGGRASCRCARRSRHHDHRDDARRRFRRPFRLGLRRRRPFRTDAPVRHARTICARSSIARTRWASASSSTWSTTTSVPTGTTSGFLARLLHRRYETEWGDAINFERRRPLARSSSRTPATGSTSSISTGCGSTRRRPFSTISPEHVVAELIRKAARKPDRARSTSSRRTSRRTPASFANRRRADTAATRSGTTTTITPLSSR